jgi:hypothetical protein
LDFVYRNPEVERQLDSARSIEALETSLQRLSALVPTFLAPEIRGRQMFCPGFDAAVPELARRLQLADVPRAKSNDNVVILATRFYPTGGHSKVAADISQMIGAERTTIVFTDIYRQRRYSQFLSFYGDPAHAARALVILSAATQAEKIVELYHVLSAVRPTRIFLMGNHMDMVAVAGAWPFRSVVDYVHHADHMPTLGATLPFSGHADLTYAAHLACRDAGLHAAYVGMAIDRQALPAPTAQPPGQRLRLATCGALHKYRQPAAHRWTDFVVAALKSADAEMVHIGPYDAEFQAEVAAALTGAGLESGRYQFAGPLPDLREALMSLGASVYVASYPDSGGRAILEAMAVGVPPIVPVAEEQGELLHCKLPIGNWIPIRDPSETAGAIKRALALGPALRGPEGRAELAEEFSRFQGFVAGDPA